MSNQNRIKFFFSNVWKLILHGLHICFLRSSFSRFLRLEITNIVSRIFFVRDLSR